MRIVHRIHESGLTLSPQQFFVSETLSELAASITSRSSKVIESPCLALLRKGSGAPLFLFHSTPGDVLGYRTLVHELSGFYPCIGVQSLGLEDPSLGHSTLEGMATHYANLVVERCPDGPYHLGGWCFGGTTAHAVACELRKRGHQVANLFLMEAHPRMRDPLRLRERWHQSKALLEGGPPLWKRFASERIRTRLHPPRSPMDVFALEVDSGPFAHRRRIYERNYQALLRHRSDFFQGHAYLLRAPTAAHDVEAFEDYGWSKHVASLTTHMIAGQHEALLHAPHVLALADTINAAIHGASSGT